MAFCCCKSSKGVEQNEEKELQTGLLHAEKGHDKPITSDKKTSEPLVAMRVTDVVDIGQKCATGVAKLAGSIYILCKNPSSIMIHRDESPFDRTDEVSLGDLEAPNDMTSSIKSSCLYLTDCKSNRVYKLTCPSHDLSPWLDDIGYPHTLTVTSPDDQVLLLRYGTPSSLEIYGSDDVKPAKVRSIQLSDEIEFPKHAVRTSGGNYVVSGKAKGSEAWGVFEINVEGAILHRLTPDTQLTEPYHIAIDSADRLIVADWRNHRLLIIDAQLIRSEELLPKDNKGLRWPWRLHYVASDKQVLVLQHCGTVGRSVADGEKGAAEGQTQADEKAEEKKTEKNEEQKKTTEENGETQSEGEKEIERATAEEKKADKEEDEENAEGEDKKSGEEAEEKKDEDKGTQEKKLDTEPAIVYIYSYI